MRKILHIHLPKWFSVLLQEPQLEMERGKSARLGTKRQHHLHHPLCASRRECEWALFCPSGGEAAAAPPAGLEVAGDRGFNSLAVPKRLCANPYCTWTVNEMVSLSPGPVNVTEA